MIAKSIITMTTDFGYNDPFVGVMKGVVLSINPGAAIVDLDHGIKSHDIKEAAFTIGMNYRFFPEWTVHLVIVDPGVGSSRRPILVAAGRYFFIGPDNGIFSYVYEIEKEDLRVVHITAEHYMRKPASKTFQGRDIFAPVAGWLTRGISDISHFGDFVQDYKTVSLPVPKIGNASVVGEIIHIDKFGNAISNISMNEIDTLINGSPDEGIRVLLKGAEISLKEFYSQDGNKGLYCLMNSSGYLEFFVFQGMASSEYGINNGDSVEIVAVQV